MNTPLEALEWALANLRLSAEDRQKVSAKLASLRPAPAKQPQRVTGREAPQRPCPWRVSLVAVCKYLEIVGKPRVTHGPEFDEAERALEAIARSVVEKGSPGHELSGGRHWFRGPRPLRLRLVVDYKRPDRELPALIDVLPDSPSRSRPYSKSSR